MSAGEVAKAYHPAVVTEDVWRQNRQAMRARTCQRGRICPQVSNLFTALVWEGEHRCQYRANAGTGYLQTGVRQSPGIRYDVFERVVLRFVRTVQIQEGDGNEYENTKRAADQFDNSIRKLQAQMDNDPGMADMLPTLARWEREQREAVEKLEAASVPTRARHMHALRLVDAMAEAKGVELEIIRREVRQAVRGVVERVDVTILPPAHPSWRCLRACVRLVTGGVHLVVYSNQGDRLTEAFHAQVVDDHAEHIDIMATGPAPAEVRERDELKEKCRSLRAEGKSDKEITAATGLHRGTVYTYTRDYRRPCRK